MNILALLFGKNKNKQTNSFGEDSQLEALIKQGEEQFKTLMDKGLGVPVALL